MEAQPPNRTARRMRWAHKYWTTQPATFRLHAEKPCRATHYERMFRVVRDGWHVCVSRNLGESHLRRLTKAAQLLFALGDDD
jgi:hypothetical protein